MNDHSASNGMAHANGAFTGFIFGVALGAGVALLLAPATGAETRKRLSSTARRLGKDAADRIGEVKDTVAERIGEVKDTVVERIGEVKDTVASRATEVKDEFKGAATVRRT